MSRNFGETLGQRLHAEHRPVLLARALPQTDVAIAEVRSETPTGQRSDPLPGADTFVVAVQLRDFPVHEWWEDGRRAPITALNAGQTTLYDLKRDPRFLINNPFHSIHVELPRALLDAMADESGARRLSNLEYVPGAGIDDPILMHLALALRPVFSHAEQASRLFVDYIARAIATHVVATYGGVSEPRVRAGGGLAPWQVRRAAELVDAHLDGNLTMVQLAHHCGLSTSYFTRAFKKTTGVTPHRWLMQKRVERAVRLLSESAMPLADVALACGFANQSHFTRVFATAIGCPPREWRRRLTSK